MRRLQASAYSSTEQSTYFVAKHGLWWIGEVKIFAGRSDVCMACVESCVGGEDAAAEGSCAVICCLRYDVRCTESIDCWVFWRRKLRQDISIHAKISLHLFSYCIKTQSFRHSHSPLCSCSCKYHWLSVAVYFTAESDKQIHCREFNTCPCLRLSRCCVRGMVH